MKSKQGSSASLLARATVFILLLCAVLALLFAISFEVWGPAELAFEHSNSKSQTALSSEKQRAPFCDLNSPDDASVLENAVWIDPLQADMLESQTLVAHPTSTAMTNNLKERIWKDPQDANRLERIARLLLDTRSHCRLKDWDPVDFKSCLARRRLVVVGDSMSMQQTESLCYLLNLSGNWTKVDSSMREKGNCRHCIDAMDETGLHIIGRAIFHSSDDDNTPLRFNKEAWAMMVADFGGWKAGDILVVNFGAHYNANLMDLRTDLYTLFHEVLAKLPRYVTTIWRDYAPAHFQTFSDGEYSPSHWIKYKNEPACVPHLTAPRTPSIVKKTVNQIIEDCGAACQSLQQLNAWDLLRNAWDQHTSGSHCFEDDWCDCRHYAIPGPMDYLNVLLYNKLCSFRWRNE